MEFLYFLEKIRIPVVNEFMLAITHLGSETAFLVVALILFWCVDKRRGYYILSVGFIGTLLNQFMKLSFRVDRPFEKDPGFTILEQAREEASGFSFPSGHTQSSVGTFGGIAHTAKRKCVKIVAIIIAVLVPFSRMYVGVHTPLDVLVAAAIAVSLIFILKPFIYENDGKYFPLLLGIMILLSVGYLCFVELYRFPENVNPERLLSGVESAYTLIGSLLGLVIVYCVDKKWLNFSTDAVWWSQIIKVAVGFGAVMAVKVGTKSMLNMLMGDYVGRAVRYFLIVIVAGVVWPITFKFFGKLGKKRES